TRNNGHARDIIARPPRYQRQIVQGSQLAQTLGLVQGSRLNSQPACAARRRTRVLIIGVNGLIGNHLTERLLREDNYE
ncbi:hypothetical protein O5962_28705, partial [Escherichia coli]|nr:hypothetical protein [Escherichia coli]